MSEFANNEIIIAGQRFALAGRTVVTWEDIGGLSFPAKRAEAMAATGSNLYQDRSEKGKPIRTYDELVGKVKQVILHTDLASDASRCFAILVNRGLSTHFIIDWDGTIFQTADVLWVTYHAGEYNKESIGIDLNNLMPNLERDPRGEPYPSDHPRVAEMQKKEFKRPRSGRMRINGGKVQSYGYTDAQYQSLIALLKVLTDQLEIPKQVPFDARGEIVPDVLQDPSFSGTIAHWHVSPDRWDPGPGFDWQRVYYGMLGEFNAFPIELDEGVNITQLMEPEKVREYADQYYSNNETQGNGGWYPMGINQTWHGGIHLVVPDKPKRRVFSMFDGVLVAARFGKAPTRLGHNNFMLLRHDIPIPAATEGGEAKTFIFYSLYMHLEPIDFNNLHDDTPPWVKEVMRIDAGKTDEEEAGFEAQPDGNIDDDGRQLEFGDPDEDIVEGAIDTKTLYLQTSEGLSGLRTGRIAKIPYKASPVRIRANDHIAYVGKFGQSQDDWRSQLHVEVFADPARDWKEAVNLGIHGRHLVELEDDVGTDLFVENQEILGLFGSRQVGRPSLVPQRTLSQSEIQELFTIAGEFEEERRFLRKVVVRHVSEWSDRVDWVTSLSKAQDWTGMQNDFRQLDRNAHVGSSMFKTVLPWIWLTRDVAEHIGLEVSDWRGMLDHFHPIQFLLWLTFHSTQRLQTVSRGVSKAKLKKLQAEAKQAAEEGRFQNERTGFGASFFIEEAEDEDAGVVLDQWFRAWDQGEWTRTPPSEQ